MNEQNMLMEMGHGFTKRRRITTQWDKEDTQKLIIECEKNPSLWDPSHPEYKDRSWRIRLLSNIADVINKDMLDVSNKWQNLRSQYNAERRKFLKHHSVDSKGNSYKIKWEHYGQLKFLTPTCHSIYNLEPLSDTANDTANDTLDTLDTADDSSSVYRLDPLCSTPPRSRRSKKHRGSSTAAPAPAPNKEDILKQAVDLMQKKIDGEQIFGDYVAEKLRHFPQPLKEEVQLRMERVLMEATETNLGGVSAQHVEEDRKGADTWSLRRSKVEAFSAGVDTRGVATVDTEPSNGGHIDNGHSGNLTKYMSEW